MVKRPLYQLNPDEIFLDSTNLPLFETERFEGHIERALSKQSLIFLGAFFLLVGVFFTIRTGLLQIVYGKNFAIRSEANHLEETIIPADRGLIYDRNGELLVWNEPDGSRHYKEWSGLAHVLGYVGLASEPENDVFLTERIGKAGIEKILNDKLRGSYGLRIEEINARDEMVSDGIKRPSIPGKTVVLTIDAQLQTKLFYYMQEVARERGFDGGSGIVMNVTNGEVLAISSFPEFDSNILSQGKDVESINKFLNNPDTPFLNRATEGLYSPGSTIKPFIAIGALEEGVIDSEKEILSTGSINVPNPFQPNEPSIFVDWKAHGWVDMRRALAISSNVYFYEVGGGFGGQRGIGISNIEKYARLFGFGTSTRLFSQYEPAGTIPSPRWKAKMFDGEPWRIGDTYHTAIGQYGFQVTPLQMARAIGGIATGKLITPILTVPTPNVPEHSILNTKIPVKSSSRQVVTEGMRMAVTDGIASMLYVPGVLIAAKSGTAEIDASKRYVNSWIVVFWPSDAPR